MSYEHLYKYKKWLIGINNYTDEQLKELGLNEQKIMEINNMNLKDYNAERRFDGHENIMNDEFFKQIEDKSSVKDIITIEDILDEIENEIIYEIISNADSKAKQIIELKYQGYDTKEISVIMGISIYEIYRSIKKLKDIFHSMNG